MLVLYVRMETLLFGYHGNQHTSGDSIVLNRTEYPLDCEVRTFNLSLSHFCASITVQVCICMLTIS